MKPLKQNSHTPGPWTALEGVRDTFNLPQYQRKDRCYVVLDNRRLPIAEIRMGNPSANARLIAAAPELLAALQAIVHKGGYNAADPAYTMEFERALEAIENATGGAE